MSKTQIESQKVCIKKTVTYLGHVVSEKGIETDKGKTETTMNWPAQNTTEVHSFPDLPITIGASIRSMLRWQNHCTE